MIHPTDILTVKHINAYMRELCDTDELLSDVWVQGEVSNFKQASSGHCYFSLKEDKYTLKTVMWRSHADNIEVLPNTGDQVLVHGYVSFYETGGDLQLYGDRLYPAGMGVLHARFEERKARLSEEGLFDATRKRRLPALPRRIGVATSADGAALRDILHVLSRRFPLGEVIISPCLVQGEKAAASIVESLHKLYAEPVDVIILARGGGSIEDLWSFNEEIVARAVYASPVPLITGVGHETDTTMVDYVADLRAPTPSAAAEVATPEYAEVVMLLTGMQERMDTIVQDYLDSQRTQIDAWEASISRYRFTTYFTQARQQVDDLLTQATSVMHQSLALAKARLEGLTTQMQFLSPLATLDRGYALVWQTATNTLVTQTSQVTPGDQLTVMLPDGNIQVTVTKATL